MGFILKILSGGVQGLAKLIVDTALGAVAKYVLGPLLNLIQLLLKLTVFHPETLSGPSAGIVGTVAAELFKIMGGASVGVALVATLWYAFGMHLTMLSGKDRAWTELLELGLVWMLMLLGGFAFVSAMLTLNDAFVASLLSGSSAFISSLHNGLAALIAGLLAGTAITLLGGIFWFLALGVIVVFLAWAVITWAYRTFELILFTSFLPVTAALRISGFRNAFDWNLREVMGAVFSQAAMAVVWYTTMAILGTSTLSSNAFVAGGQQLVEILLAVVGFYSMAKAPSWIQQIIGNQSAGLGSIAAGAFVGATASRAASGLMKATPAGIATEQALGALRARTEGNMAQKAAGPSVGERLSPTMQALGGVAEYLGGGINMGGGLSASTAGHMLASSPLGQAVGKGAHWAANTAPATGLRTAGSMVYQPRLTMARSFTGNLGAEFEGKQELQEARATAADDQPLGGAPFTRPAPYHHVPQADAKESGWTPEQAQIMTRLRQARVRARTKPQPTNQTFD